MPDPTQTPDLAAAGAHVPESSLGLLDSITATQGNIPTEAIASLLSGPTMGQRMAQAAVGGVAFMRNQPNPVTGIINDQYRQNLGIAEMMRRMQEHNDLSAYRQSELNLAKQRILDAQAKEQKGTDLASFNFAMGALRDKNSSPELVESATRTVQALGPKVHGMAMPSTVINRTLDEKEQSAFLMDAFRNAQRDPEGKLVWAPDTIARLQQRHPLVGQDAANMANTLNNPGVLKSIGAQTNEEREKELLGLEEQRLKTAALMVPPAWRSDPRSLRGLLDMAESMFPGQDVNTLSRADQTKVSQAYDLQQRQIAADTDREKRDLQFQNNMALLTQRGEQQIALALMKAQQGMEGGKPLTDAQQLNGLKPFNALSGAIRSLDMLAKQAKESDDRAWPKGDDALSMWTAKIYREKFVPGAENIYNLRAEALNVLSGVVSRGFYDDKGNRALATMRDEIEASNNLPSKKTFLKFLDLMKGEMAKKMKNDLQTIEDAGINAPKLISGAKSAIGRTEPTAPEAQPSPLNPTPTIKAWFRNTKTGARRQAEYTPGDPIPPGWIKED